MNKPKIVSFLALAVLLCPVRLMAQARTVALTIDDLPVASGNPDRPANRKDAKRAAEINRTILKALAKHNAPVTGFVIEQTVEQLGIASSTTILKQWIRPGFDLGNHTYSHPDIDGLSVQQIKQEIIRGETTFAPLLLSVSRKPRFFRFPYNHAGDTEEKHDAVAAFLAERGYRSAPCTIDNSDYLFNTTYFVALARHDKQAATRVRADYLAYTGAEIDFYTSLNKQALGYDPPQIMLLHDSPLNADTIEELLCLFEKRGYRFITLAEAESDPIYTAPDKSVTKFGPMWGYRWAQSRHIKLSKPYEPDPPVWIEAYAKAGHTGQQR